MREIIADVLASPIPVIGYVAPSGAHAASAGTYILYATHIAAMAPGTNIGAATPVRLASDTGLPSGTPDKDKKDGDRQGEPKEPWRQRRRMMPSAFIRSLAELRGRNCRLGREGGCVSRHPLCHGALQANVIDLMARDRPSC